MVSCPFFNNAYWHKMVGSKKKNKGKSFIWNLFKSKAYNKKKFVWITCFFKLHFMRSSRSYSTLGKPPAENSSQGFFKLCHSIKYRRLPYCHYSWHKRKMRIGIEALSIHPCSIYSFLFRYSGQNLKYL